MFQIWLHTRNYFYFFLRSFIFKMFISIFKNWVITFCPYSISFYSPMNYHWNVWERQWKELNSLSFTRKMCKAPVGSETWNVLYDYFLQYRFDSCLIPASIRHCLRMSSSFCFVVFYVYSYFQRLAEPGIWIWWNGSMATSYGKCGLDWKLCHH